MQRGESLGKSPALPLMGGAGALAVAHYCGYLHSTSCHAAGPAPQLGPTCCTSRTCLCSAGASHHLLLGCGYSRAISTCLLLPAPLQCLPLACQDGCGGAVTRSQVGELCHVWKLYGGWVQSWRRVGHSCLQVCEGLAGALQVCPRKRVSVPSALIPTLAAAPSNPVHEAGIGGT